ncbi:oxidoreductase [Granulicella sp. dw_53]|uniref:oxidoreductase n=1 Tax=Granulicella sp. dw_53 TaxID=2719792 RepID=UPI001BD2F045|nr:oxidoreductase [Granulicella sp. dw_53]
MYTDWTAAEIPDQTGRRVLITGANSGIGYITALKLARKGATIVMACRDEGRGKAAISRILAEAPGGRLELVLLDLASLASVREVAAREVDRGLPLDLLINNAGVRLSKRQETKDGFEMQFGTNVLGHFALTGLLLPALERATAQNAGEDGRTRVVTVSSSGHRRGQIDFDDLHSTQRYHPQVVYQRSKLGNLMFSFELERRLKAESSKVASVAAHPGTAETGMYKIGSGKGMAGVAERTLAWTIGAFLNSDAEGALPTLFAATAPEAKGGGYYGPQGFREMRGGDVGEGKVAPQALDRAAAARLWGACEDLTGVRFLHG